ncbi:MAG TPA: HlyD family secretion protein [Candidatus Sulfotelmatobacter sp.]|jgi:membrane fusion protein, multidrug efflux system|nr:HlyD family secretion protein [Candidatus Sulfotelmatobacter sp.]
MAHSAQVPPAEVSRPEAAPTKPLPATEKDFHTRPPRAQSSVFRIGLAIGVVVLLVVGIFVYRYVASYEATDDAQVDGHVNSISARISGHVIKLNVEDNQYVQAGTVLVEIDPADYQVAYERAKADFEDAQAAALAAGVNVPITSVNTSSQVSATEADVNSARAGIQAAKQQFEAAKAQLQQAEANNVKAQNDLIRYKQLVDKQEISEQLYDQAVAVAQAGAAGVEAARASADAAQQQVTQAQGKLVQAEANQRYANTAPKQVQVIQARATSALAQAQRKKADLDQAQLNLQYTRIVAPVNGIVSDRTVEVGQNVAPGQELMKVINLDDVWFTGNFKETQLRKMKVGQKVTIEVDANGRTYNGKVDSIAGASGARFSLLPPENATGNYVKVVQRIPVKIVLDPGSNKDHQLRPGMSVTPKVWTRE